MRIPAAVAQVPVCWSVRRNVGTILDAIGGVAAGTVLVLPECALSGYDDRLSGLDRLDPAELAAARDEVARAAQRSGVHVFCGTLLPEHGRWWNAAYYFPPGGEPWVYRKVNLAMHERGRLAAGAALPTAAVRLPSGVLRAGVQLCREIRFPEQWACLARQGAQALIYLIYAVNPAEPPGVWRAHLISRAAETQRFVLAANVAGQHQHCPTMIVSPRGQVLAEAATGQTEIVRHIIDLAATRDGYLSQQRGDLIAVSYRPGQAGQAGVTAD
jgi:predicted amidohydrolase